MARALQATGNLRRRSQPEPQIRPPHQQGRILRQTRPRSSIPSGCVAQPKLESEVPIVLEGPSAVLAERLKDWRAAEASGWVSAYVVLHNRTLNALAAARPQNPRELLGIEGVYGPLQGRAIRWRDSCSASGAEFVSSVLKSSVARFIWPSERMCTVRTFRPASRCSFAIFRARFQWCHWRQPTGSAASYVVAMVSTPLAGAPFTSIEMVPPRFHV